jgi:protein-disulfide isomerase
MFGARYLRGPADESPAAETAGRTFGTARLRPELKTAVGSPMRGGGRPAASRHFPENELRLPVNSLACAALALAAAAPALATRVEAPGPDVPTEEARRYFTEDPDAPMVAPKGYDVTIVEYLDYQCPACRSSHEPLKQLLAKDKKVRVIFRDWPIFGDASAHAALIAIASKYQGKYVAVHDALLRTPRPLTNEKIEAAARKAGVDWDQLQKDIGAHSEDIEDLLARNDEQAQLLGLDGTPGFIIGDVQSFGGMTLEQLEQSVKEARSGAAASAADGSRSTR